MRKPYKVRKPLKQLVSKERIYLKEGQSLQSIIDYMPDNTDFSKVTFSYDIENDYDIGYDCEFDYDETEYHPFFIYEESVDNPNYEKEFLAYKEKIGKYKEDMKEYEEAIKKDEELKQKKIEQLKRELSILRGMQIKKKVYTKKNKLKNQSDIS